MPSIRELLNRFRPAGAPGGPGPAAVPADRVAELQAELAPVFEALGGTTAEAAAVGSAAAAEAAARRETGTQAALTVVAQAHRDADAERAAAFSAGQAGAEAAAADLIEDGRRTADEIHRLAAERLPDVVAGTVAAALAQAGLSPAGSAPAGLFEAGVRGAS